MMAMVSILNPRKSEHFVKCQHFFGCILELEKVKTLG